MINTYPLARGVASYIFPRKFFVRPGSGGSFSSEYCYSVWLRHLIHLKNSGLIKNVTDIKNLAEIGPGDSLGIGLAAMYTGADNYYAFDVIKHTNKEKNKAINDELLQLFRQNKDIPNGTHQFRNTNPVLRNYTFPAHLINFEMDHYKAKHDQIATALDNLGSANSSIRYVVPWMGEKQEGMSNIDLIVSQAVMEHVDDIEFAYSEMQRWLKPGGIVSHQVDFKAHEMTNEWDGHFYIQPFMWNILAHGRKYPMNRFPLSAHINAMEKVGLKIKNVLPVISKSNFTGKKTTVPDTQFNKEDLTVSSALIQAAK